MLAAFALGGMCWITACKSKPVAEAIPTEQNDSIPYFDTRGFFEEQLTRMDSFPYFINRITRTNGRRDSVQVFPQEVHALAKPFTEVDISDKKIKKYYHERLFQDNTLGTLTLSYSTQHPDLPVRTVDVLLDDASQKPKTLLINRSYHTGDSSVTEKLGWFAGKSFYINKEVVYKDGRKNAVMTQVFWQ